MIRNWPVVVRRGLTEPVARGAVGSANGNRPGPATHRRVRRSSGVTSIARAVGRVCVVGVRLRGRVGVPARARAPVDQPNERRSKVARSLPAVGSASAWKTPPVAAAGVGRGPMPAPAEQAAVQRRRSPRPAPVRLAQRARPHSVSTAPSSGGVPIPAPAPLGPRVRVGRPAIPTRASVCPTPQRTASRL